MIVYASIPLQETQDVAVDYSRLLLAIANFYTIIKALFLILCIHSTIVLPQVYIVLCKYVQ